MFSDALKKRLDTIPALSAKDAEQAYWKKPTTLTGQLLKMIAAQDGDTTGLHVESAEIEQEKHAAEQALEAADLALEELDAKNNELKGQLGKAEGERDKLHDLIGELCVEVGVDLNQDAPEVIASVIELIRNANEGKGETDDKAEGEDAGEDTETVGSVTPAD